MDGNAVDWFLDRHVRDGDGKRTAFIDPWRDLTYAGLATETRRFAAALHRDVGHQLHLVLE